METVARAKWTSVSALQPETTTEPNALGYFQFFLRPSGNQENYNLDQIKIMLSVEFDSLYRTLRGAPLAPLGVHLNWAHLDEEIENQRAKLAELLPKVLVTLDPSRVFLRGDYYHKELVAWQYAKLIEKKALLLADVPVRLDRYHPEYEVPPRRPAWIFHSIVYDMEDITTPLKNPRYSDCAMVPMLLSCLPILQRYQVDSSVLASILDWLVDPEMPTPPLDPTVLTQLQQAFTQFTPIGQLKSQNRLELEITKNVVSVVAPQAAPRGYCRVVQRPSGKSPKPWEEWCGDTLRLSLACKDISNWAPLAAAKRIRRFARAVYSARTEDSSVNSVLNTFVEWSLNQLVAKVTRFFELGDYDNAVSEVMTSARRLRQFLNLPPDLVRRHQRIHLTLVAPIMPHTCEYLWHTLGFSGVLLRQGWPTELLSSPKQVITGTLTHHILVRMETRDRLDKTFPDHLLSKKHHKCLPDLFEEPSIRHWFRNPWTPWTHHEFPEWIKQEVVFLLLVLSNTPLPLNNFEILQRIIGPVVDLDVISLDKAIVSVVRASHASKAKSPGPTSPAQLRIHNYYAKPKAHLTQLAESQ